MAFAQEVRDFVSAFTAMSNVLGTRSEREMERADKQSLIDYRNTETAKTKWDMGAADRERADIISFAGGDGTEPWGTQPSFSDSSTTGKYSSGLYNAPAAEQAFADYESSGGNWHAKGPVTKSGDRAYGKYQVMGANIPGWTEQYFGQQLSPEEFLANPDAQQAVFHGEMGRLFGQYGNIKDAASVWFTGSPYSQTANTNINDRYTDVDTYVNNVANAYARYSAKGKVAELAGGDAADTLSQGDTTDLGEEIPAGSEDYTVPPGGNVDIPPGVPDIVTGGDSDPLGTSDADYRLSLAGRPSVMVPGPLPGGSGVTPAEVPGTEPVSTTPEAVPETPARRRAMGFDPLPQTTGYTDPVSASGHESLSPSSQEAARRVAMGEGDNIPIKGLLRKVLGGARQILGGKEPGAVDDGTDDPVDGAIMSGAGGAPVPLVQAVEHAIDPDQKMPDKLRHIRAIQKIYNYYRLSGDEKKATMASFGLYQTYKVMSQKSLAMAQEFAQSGDIEGAMQSFIDAYDLVPNGDVMEAKPNDDGTFTITTKDVETGKVLTSKVATPRDIMSQIMQVTPDEFDALVMRPSVGEAGMSPTTTVGGAIGGYEDLPTGDEAVSEGAPPADAEVAPSAPVEPGSGGNAGADQLSSEAVPTDTTGDTGDVITGGTTDNTAETTAVPTTVGATTGTPAIPENLQINPHPKKPPSNDTVQAYIKHLYDTGRSSDAAAVQARYDRDVLVYNNYAKNLLLMQKAGSGAEASAAYNEFYNALGAAGDDEQFKDYEHWFGRIGNATIVNSMRSSADAHNAAAKLLNDETLLRVSEGNLQILTSKYVPTDTYQSVPDQPEAPAAVQPRGWGLDNEFVTDITGEGAAPNKPVDFPSEDPLVLGLNKADRDTFEQRIKDANAAITTQGAAFGPSTETPLSIDDIRQVDADLEQARINTQSAINANADPTIKHNAVAAFDIINNRGHIVNVNTAAQELMQLRKYNRGMNVEGAFQQALNYAMPNMADMRKSMYQAERVPPENGMPAGMVRVYRKGADPKTGVIISEGTFRNLDEIRQTIATELVNAETEREHKNFVEGVRTKETLDANDASIEARREEMNRQAEQPDPENYPFGLGGQMDPGGY